MPDSKTQPSTATVEQYLDAIENSLRRQDCRDLAELIARVTGEAAQMSGTAIVGFGVRSYRYDGGREGQTDLEVLKQLVADAARTS